MIATRELHIRDIATMFFGSENMVAGKKRAHRLVQRPNFPAAIGYRSGRIWDREAVIQWASDEGYWDDVTETIAIPNGQKAHKCLACGRRTA